MNMSFYALKCPLTPLAGSSAVSSLVNRAARRARLSARRIGAHILRHTAASLMLRKGAWLETISDLLRHQSLDTTALYAKVDDVIGNCSALARGGAAMLMQAIDSCTADCEGRAAINSEIQKSCSRNLRVSRPREARSGFSRPIRRSHGPAVRHPSNNERGV